MSFALGRIGIWTGAFDAHSTAVAQDGARHLESLGYPTLWIPEAVGRDPFVASANLLAATTTLRLATGIANIYARDPMTTVACQNTLAEAYPDRFLLGLGVSRRHLVANVRKCSARTQPRLAPSPGRGCRSISGRRTTSTT